MHNNYNERVLSLQVKQLTLNIQHLASMLKLLNQRVESLEKSHTSVPTQSNIKKDEIVENDTNQESDVKVVITEQ